MSQLEEIRKRLEAEEAFESSAEIGLNLLAALEAVEALHRPEKRWMPYRDADCSYDTAEEAALDFSHSYTTDPSQMPYFEVCAHCKTVEDGVCEGECTRENGYRESLWPCPTIKVIKEALQ